MRQEINWGSRLDQRTAERILEKLEQRMCCERILKIFARWLGLSHGTPFYNGMRWVKRDWESPVVGQLLGMLRRTNPYGADLERRRRCEGRTKYYAEANLVELLKTGCRLSGRPDLSGVDLSGLDLTCVSLESVILSRPGLEDQKEGLYANLTGAVLGPSTFARKAAETDRRLRPAHGTVFCVSPVKQAIRLSVFCKTDGVLYFYRLRDGKELYVCGYSFPETERPEEVLCIHVDWPGQRLYAFENDGIHSYHLITGKKMELKGREFIPVPYHVHAKTAAFSPDGRTVEMTADMTDGEEGWICWSWYEEPDSLKGQPMKERRRILQIAMDSRDVEQGRDSRRRYLLTGSLFMDEEDLEFQRREVYRLEDGSLKRMPGLDTFYTPCIFRGEGLGGIMEEETLAHKPWKLWKRIKSGKLFYEEENSYRNFRYVSWYTGKLQRSLLGNRVKKCRIDTDPFFYESSYAAFEDGALEINGLWVYHYVMKSNGVKCYTGELYDEGWHMGCKA